MVKKYMEYILVTTFWCQTGVRHCDKHTWANIYDMPKCDKPHEVYTDERPYGTYLTCHTISTVDNILVRHLILSILLRELIMFIQGVDKMMFILVTDLMVYILVTGLLVYMLVKTQ